MRAWLVIGLLLIPSALAQVPGLEDAITDQIPFQLDSDETLDRVAAFANDVSGQGVHDCVRDITSDPTTAYRLMGTPTQSAFVNRHEHVWSDMGMPSALQHFEKGSAAFGAGGTVFGEGGTNIVGVLPGNDPTKWVVIGGHYDTREGSIGALDNGSGICTVKEIARAMVKDTQENGAYEASMVFVWYDGEEWGLYGAIAFAQDHAVAKELLGLEPEADVDILVSQSFDMPGINFPARNIWVRYGDDPVNTEKRAVLNLRTAPIHAENEWTCWSYGCYEDLKARADFEHVLLNNTNYQFLVREVAYDLMGFPPEYVWVYDDHYGRSDHIPLIAQGSAGMRIQGSHDEQYPCYHQPCDTLEWLYVQTGSQAELIAAYDAEASIGGTVAMYTSLIGMVGFYGVDYLEDQGSKLVELVDYDAMAALGGIQEATAEVAEQEVPVGPIAIVALLVALARRR